jgi:hypothetical protein
MGVPPHPKLDKPCLVLKLTVWGSHLKQQPCPGRYARWYERRRQALSEGRWDATIEIAYKIPHSHSL